MKFNEHLVLEFIVRFELSVQKDGFSWEASIGSSGSLNVIFF